ncbi:alpha/beta fold hydrolase [Stomatohabitans albus]|uniref:alpha/beta fold hydrolase n=1 Tax=Stomatohabitans albus TaxID=3110766 RepID=UPI00300D61CC
MYMTTYGPESGVPLLFLHGGTGTGESHWKRQIKPFSEAGYRLYIPDLPGHGESVLDDPETYNRQVLIDAVVELLEAKGPMVCVGFSMGGHTLLGMLQDERTHPLVLGLVLIGVSIDDNAALQQWRKHFHPDSFARANPLFVRGMSRRHFPQGGPDAWRDVLIRDSAGSLEVKVDLEPISRLKVPTMVMRGDRDRAVDRTHHTALREMWTHADVCVIPAGGHDVQMLRSDLFNAILMDFLERNDKHFVPNWELTEDFEPALG